LDQAMLEGDARERAPEDEERTGQFDGATEAVQPQQETGYPAASADGNENELARAGTRIAELEGAVADRDAEISSLRQQTAGLETLLEEARGSLAETVSRYRDAVVRMNPEVPGELVTGDSIESVDSSLEQARSLVGKVREGLEKEVSRARVPAGAPERRTPDLFTLSPREKIRYGIESTR